MNNIDEFFKQFDAEIDKAISSEFENMANQVKNDTVKEAKATIQRFYDDFQTRHTNGHYLLGVPHKLLPHMFQENPPADALYLMNIYWRRSYNLFNAIRGNVRWTESDKKKGKYRYQTTVVVDSKYMDQSKHRMPVNLVLKRSYELGIHGYNKNDMDNWVNKNTKWYLPRKTTNKSQPYKKRGKYYMNLWRKRYYKKMFVKGELSKKYIERMIKRIYILSQK